MTTTDWLWILHPALMVVVAYPLLGMVLQLARNTRLRRLGVAREPLSSGAEHTRLGKALAAAVVAFVLLALAVVITTKVPLAQFAGGSGRLGLLSLVWLGTAVALALLLRVRRAPYRAAFALLTWIGILALGGQNEVWRLSDNPLTAGFWQSHYWGGAGLSGLLLFAVAARPEIQRSARWRRLHPSATVLAALISAAKGMSGQPRPARNSPQLAETSDLCLRFQLSDMPRRPPAPWPRPPACPGPWPCSRCWQPTTWCGASAARSTWRRP